MSLLGRIAWSAGAMFAVALLLGLLVYKPTSRRAFVARTDGLLRAAERDFREVAAAAVDDVIAFSSEAAVAAEEQRLLSLADLPLDLASDGAGSLQPERVRDLVRAAVTDPGAALPEKHAAVRAEILDRTGASVERRLGALREAQLAEAERHGESEAWRTVAAWGGLLLLLLASGALLLDRLVVRPVREATAAVERFGAGERGRRIDPSGGAEIAALARSFNETAEAVERAESENRELRSRLEEKVRERTAALVRAARASTAGTMAGGIAHEFNNLLGGILGCADAALSEGPPREVREALEMIRKTAGRGVGITRALLHATSAGPQPAPCDPVPLVEEALAEVRPPAAVLVEREFEPVSLPADATMLRQVLSNLIRNAVEAMGGSGRLRLSVRREGDEALLSVSDSGPGIDPSVREVLFEPFVTTRRGGREGAGLGLFLAERLVAAHGGRIEVESEPGKGALFRIRLPLARNS
jgi:signal transduction histidine kinase